MNRLKNIVSFLYPVIVEAREGKVTPYLEVIKHKGKYLLNSQSVNYSFGGLHHIFDAFFNKISIDKYDFKNVLVLGMGAGSVISLLKEKYKCGAKITAIEKDEVVIEFAKKYFDIERFSDLTIIHQDAFKYSGECKDLYDLIIIDLFIEGNVPEIFASTEFLLNLRKISKNNSCIIYNKMTDHPVHKNEIIGLSEDFERIFPGTELHKLYAYNSENSLLYYNTLPIPLKIIKREDRISIANNSSILKPAFT